MEVELETQGKQGAYSDLSAISNLKTKSEFNTDNLLERIGDKKNIFEAYKKVVANKGSHGIDRMKVDELLPFLQEYYESFDNVNHDLLMNLIARKIDDKRVLKLIRKYLNPGIMLKGMLIKSAGERVFKSITKFLEQKLKLKVNVDKSAVSSPTKIKFLGYSFYYGKGGIKFRVHDKSYGRLKEKLLENIQKSYIK